jgi:hypothetical protein
MEQSYAFKSFDAYRAAFAPMLRAQHEGLKAWGRLTRFQVTIAGDVLEHNLAGIQAMVRAATPVEYLAAQGQLNAHFVGKVATHTREFLKETAEPNMSETVAAASTASQEEEQVSGVDDQLDALEEEVDEVQEEAAMSALLEDDVREYPDAVESSEAAQPVKASPSKSTKARQGKRSDRSRRGQAHH